MIFIKRAEWREMCAEIKRLNDEVKSLQEQISDLQANPTISQMTMAQKEPPSIYNEVIDEWLNGKKEDADE